MSASDRASSSRAVKGEASALAVSHGRALDVCCGGSPHGRGILKTRRGLEFGHGLMRLAAVASLADISKVRHSARRGAERRVVVFVIVVRGGAAGALLEGCSCAAETAGVIVRRGHRLLNVFADAIDSTGVQALTACFDAAHGAAGAGADDAVALGLEA